MAFPPMPPSYPSLPPIVPPGEPDGETLKAAPLLARLREATLGTGLHSRELLDRVAEAALAMTQADGVAIALRHEGRVVCVARCGAKVPDLGAPLSENSGLSGLCLRLGKTMISGETLTDARVDAALCRHLGIRSIVALPLRIQNTTIGLIEAFSRRAGAFTKEHVDFLQFVGNLVENAGNVPQKVASQPPAPRPISEPAKITAPKIESKSTARRPAPAKWYALAVCTAGIFALVAWAAWRYAPDARDDGSVPSQTANAESGTPAKTSNDPVSFTTEVMSVGPSMRSGLKPEDVTELAPTGAPANLPALAVVPASLRRKSLPILPSFDPSAAAALERSVPPVYPPEAQKRGIYGTVVLHAFITEDGGVESVEVVQGNPILAQAAMNAAKRWRYRPLLSEGKPARSEANITIKFNPS